MCCLLTLINVTDYNASSLSGSFCSLACPAVLSPPPVSGLCLGFKTLRRQTKSSDPLGLIVLVSYNYSAL